MMKRESGDGMKRFISCALALCMALGLTACFGPPVDPDTVQESIQVIAMDTAMLISTYGKRSTAAAYASEDLIRDLESKLSRTEEDSELSRLNAAAGRPVEVGPELAALLTAAEEYRADTGGAFDITVAPVVSAWGFTEDSFRVPSRAELEALLETVDGSAVRVEETAGGCTAALAPGQSADLGGIAKGYTADKLVDLFREYEIPRAMASLGGNILAWGDRPDGTPWRIGVQDPARPDEQNAFVGVLNLKDAFAVTSGGYQRYFEEGGRIYHHIIDPATGYPADGDLTSVTVVAKVLRPDAERPYGPGTMCDALSTALFVMGRQQALTFWSGRKGAFDLVLVTRDGEIYVTSGIAEEFAFEEESGYARPVVVW